MKRYHAISMKNDSHKQLDNDYILFPFVINIILFYVGVYFSKEKVINAVICTFINLLAVGLYIYIQKKVKLNQQNIRFFFGIYFLELVLSCGYLSYVLLIKVWNHPMKIILIYILGALLVALSYTFYYLRFNDEPKKNSVVSKAVITSIVAPLVIIFYNIDKSDDVSYAVLGILIGIIGILSASGTSLIVKRLKDRNIKVSNLSNKK